MSIFTVLLLEAFAPQILPHFFFRLLIIAVTILLLRHQLTRNRKTLKTASKNRKALFDPTLEVLRKQREKAIREWSAGVRRSGGNRVTEMHVRNVNNRRLAGKILR